MLEYTFSPFQYKGENCTLLRTKGDKISYEKGSYQTFTKADENAKVISSCKIGELIKEDEDTAGNNYSWYIVTDVIEKIDKSPEYDRKIEKQNAALDYLFMLNGVMPLDEEDDNSEQNV